MEFPLYGTILKWFELCVSQPHCKYKGEPWLSCGHHFPGTPAKPGTALGTQGALWAGTTPGPDTQKYSLFPVSCLGMLLPLLLFHQANLYTSFKAPAQVSCFQKPSFTFPERSHLSSFPLSTVPSTHPTGGQIIQPPHPALQGCFPSALGLP